MAAAGQRPRAVDCLEVWERAHHPCTLDASPLDNFMESKHTAM